MWSPGGAFPALAMSNAPVSMLWGFIVGVYCVQVQTGPKVTICRCGQNFVLFYLSSLASGPICVDSLSFLVVAVSAICMSLKWFRDLLFRCAICLVVVCTV